MRRFSRLVEALEIASGPDGQISLLAAYFRELPDDEKTLAIRFLYGATPRVRLNARLLKQWAMEQAGIPEWLLEEAHKVAGDTAETLALVLPGKRDPRKNRSLADWVEALERLPSMADESRKVWVCKAWQALRPGERIFFNKLLCGRFRSPVSAGVLVAAISQVTGVDQVVLTWRLHRDNAGAGGISYPVLTAPETAADDRARPYPFSGVAPELRPEQRANDAAGAGGAQNESGKGKSGAGGPTGGRDDAESAADKTHSGQHWLEGRLGPAAPWSAQRKWAGIPAQIICRDGQLFIWADTSDGAMSGDAVNGSALVTRSFPELHLLSQQLPGGTVLEGELLGLRQDRLLPAFGLEKRIARKTLTKSQLAQLPAAFLACDCLEFRGRDIRAMTWARRRQFLESFGSFGDTPLLLSPQLAFQTWDQLAGEHEHIRESGAEGLLLNRQDTPDTRWLWKATPYTFRGVLLYARGQSGGPYTHFSLGAWDQGKLLSFATVESALNGEESEALAAYIHENTTEKFGPVRTVKPGIVFEIAFDDVLHSVRHRSGLRLRCARMVGWLKESSPEEAGMLKSLRLLCDKR